MKVKFLRDYHGPETNEVRYSQNAVIELSPIIADNLISRKIVVSLEPAQEEVKEEEKDVFDEVEQPAIKIVEPKVIVKRGRKTK